MIINWSHKLQRFVAEMDYSNFESDRAMLKKAGFRFNWQYKHWETPLFQTAENLSGYLSDQAQAQLPVLKKAWDNRLVQSLATETSFEPPCPSHHEYLPYQKAGVEFLVKPETGNCLLADDMGLGKTPMSIGMINYLKPSTVLIICRTNDMISVWRDMLTDWLMHPYNVQVLPLTNRLGTITITGYDQLKKYIDLLSSNYWNIMILDESHYIKNYATKRSHYVSKIAKHTGKKVALTGTPILKRPWDLWNQLKYLDHYLSKDYRIFMDTYTMRDYFGAYVEAKNLEDLQIKLRSGGMLRREKKDVLKDLPDKIRQVLILPNKLTGEAKIRETNTLAKAQNMMKDFVVPLEESSKSRHDVGLAKLPYVLDHIENVLEEEEKIVVFAHHKDVVAQIYEKFKDKAVYVTGDTPVLVRDERIKKFMYDPKIRIFIGSIMATGQGITLTASSTVIFAESDWTPQITTQCEDRVHRIGQKNTVIIQHVLMENTVDAHMVKLMVEKQEEFERSLNKEYLSPRAMEGGSDA